MAADKKDRITFRVKLADVPLEIRCRYEKNRQFLEDYLTEEEPLFSCEPTPEDMDSMRRRMVLQNEQQAEFSEGFVENNALHALIVRGLLKYDTLLVHGSALCMDGGAYLFMASSGTGKSTHAALWRKAFGDRVRMINDDKPLLRFREDGIRVYGTPWNGKHRLGSNISAPLAAAARLERGTKNRVSRLGEAQAFMTLMHQTDIPGEREEAEKALFLVRRLLKEVPFYGLQCNMDIEAALTAWKGMR